MSDSVLTSLLHGQGQTTVCTRGGEGKKEAPLDPVRPTQVPDAGYYGILWLRLTDMAAQL